MTPRTTLVSLLAAGALAGTLAAPAAQATGTPFVPPPPPGEPVSDTGFQPVEPLTDDSFSGRACGTRITITDVPELFGVKERVREYADGTLYVQGRGRDIVLATAADGRSARLDASGPYTLIITPLPGGGEEVDVYLRGATLLLPTNRTEARALRAAGLPRFSVFTGRVQLRDVTDAEGDQTSEVVSRPRSVTNACHLLQ